MIKMAKAYWCIFLFICSHFCAAETAPNKYECLLRLLGREIPHLHPGSNKEQFVKAIHRFGGTVQQCIEYWMGYEGWLVLEKLHQEWGVTSVEYERLVDKMVQVHQLREQDAAVEKKELITFEGAFSIELQRLIKDTVHERSIRIPLRFARVEKVDDLGTNGDAREMVAYFIGAYDKIDFLYIPSKEDALIRLTDALCDSTYQKIRGTLYHELEHIAQMHTMIAVGLQNLCWMHQSLACNELINLQNIKELKISDDYVFKYYAFGKKYDAILENKWTPRIKQSESYKQFGIWQEMCATILAASHSLAAARTLESTHMRTGSDQPTLFYIGASAAMVGLTIENKLMTRVGMGTTLVGLLLIALDDAYKFMPGRYSIVYDDAEHPPFGETMRRLVIIRELLEVEERLEKERNKKMVNSCGF